MEVKIEVIACDVDPDPNVRAKSYTITADDGRTVTLDRCPAHAVEIEAFLSQPDDEAAKEEEESKPAPSPPARKTAAKKAPAKAAPKKTAAKKTTAPRRRRGIQATTLEEIEAKKRTAAQQ
jgi:hypothetical protein